jgi:hypothetical protein
MFLEFPVWPSRETWISLVETWNGLFDNGKIQWPPSYVTNGKIRIKYWNIGPTIPLEIFPYVSIIQLQYVRGFHFFWRQEMPKKVCCELWMKSKVFAISYANFRVTRFKGFHYKSLQLWSLSRSIGALANMCQHFFPNSKGKICKEYGSSWRSPFFLLLTNYHLFSWTIFQHDEVNYRPTIP